MNKSEFTLIIILVVTALLGVSYFRGVAIAAKVEALEVARVALRQAAWTDAYGNLKLDGKSAIVYDPKTNETIFALHENSPRPLASITKLMTAVIALESRPPETIVSVTKQALQEEGDSGLLVGEKWRLDDLIRFMLVASSNDATRTILDESDVNFVLKMNERAIALGLTKTHFFNETGLDLDKYQVGASSSARDTALLANNVYLNYQYVFGATKWPEVELLSENKVVHKIKNTNPLVSEGYNILASKTGFTDLAGGNLTVIFEPRPAHHMLVAVILGSGYYGRFDDMRKLISATEKYISNL